MLALNDKILKQEKYEDAKFSVTRVYTYKVIEGGNYKGIGLMVSKMVMVGDNMPKSNKNNSYSID